MSTANGEPEPVAEPLLSVTAGNPTEEELAALTAVVVGLAAQAAPPTPVRPAHRAWVRRRNLRLDPKPGPGSWRRSFR
ncbi:acyl-CoA carboxylase subunit epsilon [Arthrobacter yangruifuii]|uniref:acyl-CoA carboxylase subunit epsilon n=1 Tax=Arthrobacter yangruifuii TaxID=2606616 RepID=UPI001FEBC8DB|nr:acyl-CoA carboxylase subunit epsilon [Arthrobacter yangruifuii]